MRVVVVGMGGIGSLLSGFLCRFLNYDEALAGETELVLVDGDEYEIKNKNRQEFEEFGNKAGSKHKELIKKYDNLKIEPRNVFINKHNVHRVFRDNDIIMLCVDNHKTRKLINDYCSEKLKDFVIINGGNDLTDGSVHYYVRRDGKDLSASLTKYDEEINNPRDKSPEEMSCEELSKAEPQLFFTNLTVATVMCQIFYRMLTTDPNSDPDKKYPSIVYLDILKHTMLPSYRAA